MTSAGPNPSQSHYQVIFHCIESASRFVPPVLSPAPALQSLRDLIPSLPAASAVYVELRASRRPRRLATIAPLEKAASEKSSSSNA